MDFFNVLKNRHSVRSYKDKKIEQEKLKSILESANLAPSAGNLQAYEIVLVTDLERKKALAKASYNQNFVEQAPVVLVFFANPKRASEYGSRGRDLYSIQDATIAASYMQLAATALGLSTVWVGSFDDNGVRNAVSASKELIPVAVIPIGYHAEEPEQTSRRDLDKLVHKETFK